MGFICKPFHKGSNLRMRQKTFNRVVLPSQFRFRQRCMKFLMADTMQENRLLAALGPWNEVVGFLF